MNQLINNQSLTMSSRAMAELTGKEHKNVLRVIRSLIDQKVVAQIEPLKYEYRGQHFGYYELCKRDSLIVVARLSPEFTAAIVDRWQELEVSQFQLPKTYAQALQVCADQAFQLEAQAPKIAFVDKYVHADSGNKTFRQVCKLLNVKENVFRPFLVDEKIMYRLNGEWAAHANHITAGRFATKTGVSEHDHAFNTAYFTPKGVEWVAAQFAKFKLNEAK